MWPPLLLQSPRRVHSLFRDGRLPFWLWFLRPPRLTWTAKREAGRLPSWLQFLRPVDRDCENRGWPAILLAAVSSTVLVDRDCKTRSCSTSLLAVVSSTVSVDRDCQMRSCSASLLAAVSSTVSVDWDYETQSCSASLLAAAGYRLFGPCRRSLALLLSPPASDVPFRPRILHSLDVFAVQRIYREEQLRFGGRSAGGRHFRHHTKKKFWERNCNLPR